MHTLCSVLTRVQVSIVAFKKGQLQVLAHAWDREVGGRLFDEVLFEHFVKEFGDKHKINIKSNARASYRLRTACEKVCPELQPRLSWPALRQQPSNVCPAIFCCPRSWAQVRHAPDPWLLANRQEGQSPQMHGLKWSGRTSSSWYCTSPDNTILSQGRGTAACLNRRSSEA